MFKRYSRLEICQRNFHMETELFKFQNNIRDIS